VSRARLAAALRALASAVEHPALPLAPPRALVACAAHVAIAAACVGLAWADGPREVAA